MLEPIGNNKLAERLVLLNDRQVGMLTRLYHMKYILTSRDYRPASMPNGDKAFKPAWKALLKNFPSNVFKSKNSSFKPFINNKDDLLGQFSVYYFDFVDLLDVRDQFDDLLTQLTAVEIQLDIMLNSDITCLYFKLISNHFALMFLLTRIPDLKAIIGLFNFLYNLLHGESEPHFQRMVELIIDSPKNILRVLHRDVEPHSKVLSQALASLYDFLIVRTINAAKWSDFHVISLLPEPSMTTCTIFDDKLACKWVSYEEIVRWVVFGYLLIYPTLTQEDAFNRLKIPLRYTYFVVLFREEVVYIHALFQSFLKSVYKIMDGDKRIDQINKYLADKFPETIETHNVRRAYLRTTLCQLHLILSDEPGLLGPKALLALFTLSWASDEIHWALCYMANPPPKKSTGGSSSSRQTAVSEDFGDPLLPELLFYMEELRLLIVRYMPVIQRFYLKLLASFDAPGLEGYLNEVLPSLPSEEAMILSSISKRISSLSEDPILQEDTEDIKQLSAYKFRDVRLDWLRVQASLSLKSSPFALRDHKDLVKHLHSTILHTQLVDYTEVLLSRVSDMSNFLFNPTQFLELFNQCLKCPPMLRFSIVFPSICCHVVNIFHDLCPEERNIQGEISVRLALQCCQEIVWHICSDLLVRVNEFGELEDQLAAPCAVPSLREGERLANAAAVSDGTSWEPAPVNATAKWTGLQTAGGGAAACCDHLESGFKCVCCNREEQTSYDKTLFSLSQLCQTVNHHLELFVYDRSINPRRILHDELQTRLMELLSTYTEFTPVLSHEPSDTNSSGTILIAKPSELLRRVRALMNVLTGMENLVCLDVVSIFSNVFAKHTQPHDVLKGHPTMTEHYSKWYTEQFLKHAYQDHFVYSPLLKSFVTPVAPEVVRFRAEDFADLNELRDLAELIGTLGIKHLCDQVMADVAPRVDEIKRLVLQNRVTLELLRECFDDPAKTRNFAAKLQNSDKLLDLLKEVGVALAFRNLCLEALHDVLERRTPFLLSTINNLRSGWSHLSGGQLLPPGNNRSNAAGYADVSQSDHQEGIYAQRDSLLELNHVSASLGIHSQLDYSLCAILNSQRGAMFEATAQSPANALAALPDLDYEMACLFIVFVAIVLPRLAHREGSRYHMSLAASENNCHCIAYSVSALMVAMFSLFRPGEMEARSKEFLALASSNLLRLGLEPLDSPSMNQSTSTAEAGDASGATAASIRDSIYLIFYQLARLLPDVPQSLLEACFPYSLVRNAYHNIASTSRPKTGLASGRQWIHGHHHAHMKSSSTKGGRG